jgi:hypothetical protein
MFIFLTPPISEAPVVKPNRPIGKTAAKGVKEELMEKAQRPRCSLPPKKSCEHLDGDGSTCLFTAECPHQFCRTSQS